MNLKKIAVSAVALVGLGGMAYAGTAATEFDAAVTLMTDWLEGSLGLAVSIAFLAVGLFMGLARQNLMAAAVAVACAFVVNLGPSVLTGIVGGSAATAEMTVEADILPATLING